MTVMQEIIARTFLVVENKDPDWLSFVEKVSAKTEARLQVGQRDGQAVFNSVWDVSPLLAERFRGSHVDPFYRDDRLPEFVQALFDFWLEHLL